MCCRYSPDGTQVAVGYQDGNVKVRYTGLNSYFFILNTTPENRIYRV